MTTPCETLPESRLPVHYWPEDCQSCDTLWKAFLFECQIAGHSLRHAYSELDGYEGADCLHCGAYVAPEQRRPGRLSGRRT